MIDLIKSNVGDSYEAHPNFSTRTLKDSQPDPRATFDYTVEEKATKSQGNSLQDRGWLLRLDMPMSNAQKKVEATCNSDLGANRFGAYPPAKPTGFSAEPIRRSRSSNCPSANCCGVFFRRAHPLFTSSVFPGISLKDSQPDPGVTFDCKNSGKSYGKSRKLTAGSWLAAPA